MQKEIQIKKVIVWGHPLHSHTHSYIHNAFYTAFKELGYETHWFHDNMNTDHVDFANSLFITEHQVDKKIPRRNDCLYFVHFLEHDNYKDVDKKCLIDLKCAFRDMKRDVSKNDILEFIPVTSKNLEFYSNVNQRLTYYTLWGTDLLPHEINENIKNLETIKSKRTKNMYFVGQMSKPWILLHNMCKNSNIPFIKYGATFNVNSQQNMDIKQNQDMTQQSLISPAFQQDDQIIDTYIPCRIFKNISYGRMGITNNPMVYELFNKKIIYDENILTAVNKSLHFEENYDNELMKELMEYVRDNHTYIQRIESMKTFINEHSGFIL